MWHALKRLINRWEWEMAVQLHANTMQTHTGAMLAAIAHTLLRSSALAWFFTLFSLRPCRCEAIRLHALPCTE
jgi:hypothetical protein